MTQVYVTPGGEKYHAEYACQSLLDIERIENRVVARRTVELRGLDRQPCSVCWPKTTTNDAWSQLAREVERQGDSDFEVTFVEQVLRQVRGLDPSDVATQVPATGKSGSRYWIDFVLSPPNGMRLAVEIDGRDKDPGNRTPEEVRRLVESKRADLASGWRQLNFSNEQVATRSTQCAEEIRSAVFTAVPGRSMVEQPPSVAADHFGAMRGAEPGSARHVAKKSRTPTIAVGVAAAAAVVGFVVWQSAGKDSTDPVGGECSASAPVKGNVSQSGERIYHEPGWEYYSRTSAEECFETADDAEQGGYRPSEVQ